MADGAPGDTDLRFPLRGPVRLLCETIAAHTGGPTSSADSPAVRSALKAAFPSLPEPATFEGCTDHPALTITLRVPGLGREAVKVVFAPRGDALEVRVRAVLPGGSYRKETIARIVAYADGIEAALGHETVERQGTGGGR